MDDISRLTKLKNIEIEYREIEAHAVSLGWQSHQSSLPNFIRHNITKGTIAECVKNLEYNEIREHAVSLGYVHQSGPLHHWIRRFFTKEIFIKSLTGEVKPNESMQMLVLGNFIHGRPPGWDNGKLLWSLESTAQTTKILVVSKLLSRCGEVTELGKAVYEKYVAGK